MCIRDRAQPSRFSPWVAICESRPRPLPRMVAPPGTEVMVDPRLTAFVRRFGVLSQSAHLVVSCNTGASRQEHGYLEFGFLSYYRHALSDRPFLGFRGFMAFVDDMARELVRVDLVRVQAERDAAEGGGPGAAEAEPSSLRCGPKRRWRGSATLGQ